MQRFQNMSYDELRSHVQNAVEEDFERMQQDLIHSKKHSHQEQKQETSLLSKVFRKRS